MSEFYNASGIESRQPSTTQRAVFRSVLTMWDRIEIPFEIYWTDRQSQFQQPFSQFGLSPKIFDWLRLYGGYFSTRISEFSFGDVRLLGGGIELTPGNFRFKAFYGRSREARESDTLKYFFGEYKQTTYAASIGYGNESVAYVNLNLLHSIDDSNSINRTAYSQAPTENLVSTLSFGVQPFEMVFIEGEAGVSAFSNDITSDKVNNINIPNFFFTARYSTQIDGAARLSVMIRPQSFWGLSLNSRWIGPGFTTLGYAQMVSDCFEWTVAPNFSLINNRLNMRGSLGLRTNNLRNNKASTTSRFTGSFSGDYQINQAIGLNVQFNNNQIKSTRKNDTLNISNVMNYFMLSPRFYFEGLCGINNIMLSYSYQNSEDKNPYSVVATKNLTNTFNFLHTISFPTSLNFGTNILYNTVDLSIMTVKMWNFNETVGHQFFNNRLYVSLSLGYSLIQTMVNTNLFVFRINATYSMDSFGSLSLNLTNNKYAGNDVSTVAYNEILGNLQYSINF